MAIFNGNFLMILVAFQNFEAVPPDHYPIRRGLDRQATTPPCFPPGCLDVHINGLHVPPKKKDSAIAGLVAHLIPPKVTVQASLAPFASLVSLFWPILPKPITPLSHLTLLSPLQAFEPCLVVNRAIRYQYLLSFTPNLLPLGPGEQVFERDN